MKSVALTVLLFEIAWAVSDGRLMVSIYPLGKSIISKENEDLNLTCKISGQELTGDKYDLSWSLPMKPSPNSRVTVHKATSELTVTIHNLQEGDTGQYVCEVRGGGILRMRKVAVLVKSGKEKCLKHFFGCGNGLCIPQHYVCDGQIDCPEGNDESPKYCGHNPCLGKFLCDGRCIPRKLCCDPLVDLNCSVNYIMPCCQRLLHHVADVESSSLSALQPQYGDIYFLQCTIYTIISFAIVFIFITTILAIIICRIHPRRSVVPFRRSSLQNPRARLRLWPWHPSQVDRRTLPERATSSSWNDDDQMSSCLQGNLGQITESNAMPFGSPLCQDPMENFVLLTYGSSGFEVADRIPKPPPYTEAVHCVDHSPPPPYASSRNLAEDKTESELGLVESEPTSPNAARGEDC